MQRELSQSELRAAARERFAVANRMEAEYLRSLKQVAQNVDRLVKTMVPVGVQGNLPVSELEDMLNAYGRMLQPWAKATVERMYSRVARKDTLAWTQMGQSIGRQLRKDLEEGVLTGDYFRHLMREQVKSIVSMPAEAAARVHNVTTEAYLKGERASSLIEDIRSTGSVTLSKAKLLARTGVSSASTGLVQARSAALGVTHYIWRTSGDSDVRSSHKKLNGKVFAWANPPVVDAGGFRAHPGCSAYCRCWADPILTTE